MTRRTALAALGLTLICREAHAAPSERVYLDEEGRLRSVSDQDTQRIADFSHAGYEGGGVALPDVDAMVTIGPVDGDDTASIQAAIDDVGTMPLGPDGFRGAVELMPGRYDITGTIRLDESGVVLRGFGRGDDEAVDTIIERVGPSEDPVIVVGGGDNNRWRDEIADSRSDIVSDYVQVGSAAFEVADPDQYQVGDNVVVWHPATEAWLEAIDYGATADEPPWSVDSYPMVFNRIITRIDGSMIFIDAPVFGNLDRSLSQSYIYLLDRTGIVDHVGLEDLRVQIASDVVMHAVSFVQAEDGFARRLTVRDFLLGGIHMATAKHLTIEDVSAVDPKGPTQGGRKYNFMAAGAQLVLVADGFARGGRHSFASNGTSFDSGVVFLRGISSGSLAASEGHHRWSMGLLYDGHTEVDVVYDGILLGLYNRGGYGTGHGWSTAHSVGWNCDLAGGHGVVQQPPTAQNWMIGCSGQIDGNGPFAHPTGFIESTNAPVEPASLYEAQLADRLAHPPADGSPPDGFVWVDREAEADAFVRGGPYADDNYGAEPMLVVKTGNEEFSRETFLRFEVDGIDEPYDSVWLRLRQDALGFGGMRYGLARTDGAWDEATVTWNDRPEVVGDTRWWFPEQAGDSLIDVTEWVQEAVEAGEPLSLRVWAHDFYGGRAQAAFGSREGDASIAPLLRFAVPEPEGPGTTGGDGASTSGNDTTAGEGDDGDDLGTSGGVGSSDGTGGMATDALPGDGGRSDGETGCGCRTSSFGGWPWLLVIPVVLRRRRYSHAPS